MSIDGVEEELEIMDERASEPPSVSAEIFRQSIAELCNREVRTLDASASIREAVRVMQEGRFGSVVITDEGKLAGIVTERDVLMKVAGKELSLLERPVSEIMTRRPESLRPDDVLLFLMNKMHVGGFRHVPIVDEEDRPKSVISMRDVLSFLLDHFGPVVVNIPSEPYRGERKTDGG